MLVSYEWLSQYVDIKGITPEQIAEELNRTGIEVEVIYSRHTGVSDVVVGEVRSTTPHPDADKLKVCKVSVGDETLQIVCGASNVAPGQRVPVALVGAKLPGGVQIKETKLRGVNSQGMICSAKELDLSDKAVMKEQTSGILVLPSTALLGQDINQYLGLDDQAIELQLTPNRSDCLGMIGVAYEIAAIFDLDLRLPTIELQTVMGAPSPVKVEIEAEDECLLYAAQVVRNLKVAPSPQWMQNRLIAAGIRPINNIVDVTNYVMIETGQPLHAFDYTRVRDGKIVVRRATAGEEVVTLDDVTRRCEADTLLITDGSEILGLAGVMGGADSEVTADTTSILLESAFFDPASIRKTSRRLGLRSEASSRFEKGVDPEMIVPALARAVQLLQEVAGGVVGSAIVKTGIEEVEELTVKLRHERLVAMLGVKLQPVEVLDIFRRLQLPATVHKDVYKVQIPTRRPDLELEVDLIEEIARIYGYGRIPTTLPSGEQLAGKLTDDQRWRRVVRHTLRDLGMHEVVTYSLTSAAAEAESQSLRSNSKPIPLAMPMSNEHALLRTSLLPQLLQTATYNNNHGNQRISIFELGRTYLTTEDVLTTLPEERLELTGLVTGQQDPTIWKGRQGGDFFVVKGILEALFARLGAQNIRYQAGSADGFHPGRTAEVLHGDRVIGLLGQVHPKLAKEHDLGETTVFQLDLSTLFAAMRGEVRYTPIPRFPGVTRDLAMVVAEDVSAGVVAAGIASAAGELLESVMLFDVFTGAQLGAGQKSLAYSLVYRSPDRTLTDEEVQTVHQRVVRYLEEKVEAKLRQ